MNFYNLIASQKDIESIMLDLKSISVFNELFVRFLGNPIIDDSTMLKFKCPFCNDVNPSFNVNKRVNYFNCESCNVNGDSFDFIKKMQLFDFSNVRKENININVAIFLMLLINYCPYDLNESDENVFNIHSVKFNFALFLNFKFLSKENKRVFLSVERLEKLKEEMTKLGYAKSKIKTLQLNLMKNKFIIILEQNFIVQDFILYNPGQKEYRSIMNRKYTPLGVAEYERR